MRIRTVLLALLTFILAALSGGCTGSNISLNPEGAVTTVLFKNSPSADITVDQNSLTVRQSQQLGDNYLVLVTFNGARAKAANPAVEACAYSYLVTKGSMYGWVAGSSMGGCMVPPADSMKVPVSVFSGSSSGKDDPGYSSVIGQSFLKFSKIIQLTWNDGKVEQVPITNDTFLSSRVGQFYYTKIEVIDDQEKIIYTAFPALPPGKK